MISFEEAYNMVLNSTVEFGTETTSIHNCVGRVLAEDIVADRDFPPFNRVTKDGIAINFEAFMNGKKSFEIESIAPAGSAQQDLKDFNKCIEVMTGAILPEGADTVIMYEHTTTKSGKITILSDPQKGQNIHYKGMDRKKNSILLAKGKTIQTNSIGILATVGKSEIKVEKLPTVAILSTGNELVSIDESPQPYQIRTSNSISLQQLLLKEGIKAKVFHVKDDEKKIKSALEKLITEYDVLMMSGGVSKGKFDFLPKALEQIGVTNLFHRVAQRPGKPFWFGRHQNEKTTVFSFPGNPVSTFVNYHIYFLDWLNNSLGQSIIEQHVQFVSKFHNSSELTRFLLVKTNFANGSLSAKLVNNNGSGDLASLAEACGVIKLKPQSYIIENSLLPFIPFR